MKLVLGVILVVVGLALGDESSKYEPIVTNYHEVVGIPEAARIKAAELFSKNFTSFIVSGSAAGPAQFPYQAGLIITLASGATSVCGASLLSNTRLVTAAHCWRTVNNRALRFEVVLGSIHLFSGGTRTKTSEVTVHENYNAYTLANDVAMINITWVDFSSTISPIPLATGTNDFAGVLATASGFGKTGDDVPIATNQFLSYVTLQVITNAVCQETYGPFIVTASTLCTSGVGGRSTCKGDSGGPLVANNELIGIVSFGSRSCQDGLPMGFTRVTSFASWIQERL